MEIITKSFAKQAMAFPDKVDQALAEITTLEGRKDLLSKAAAMQHYAASLKAGIEFEKPIARGVLKIKAGLGELMPRGEPGRGKKNPVPDTEFSRNTIAAFRKLSDNADRLDEYCDTSEDVPAQGDFIRWCGADNVIASKHGGGVVDWYTPEVYVDKVRATLGTIDIDPASSKWAQKTVKAKKWFDRESDGLSKAWKGNVYLNPPYKMPDVEKFVFKLCDHVEAGDVTAAALLTNNTTDPKWWQRASRLSTAICFTAGRIAFYNRAGETSSPTNGQTFMYFGRASKRFQKQFADVGVIMGVVQ